jgi:hypothetical protein
MLLGEHEPSKIRWRLADFYDAAIDAAMPETTRLANTVQTWWPAILVALTERVTNARTEGFNRIIKQTKRVGCGHRNMTNYQRPSSATLRSPDRRNQQRERAHPAENRRAGIRVIPTARPGHGGPGGSRRGDGREGASQAPGRRQEAAPRRGPPLSWCWKGWTQKSMPPMPPLGSPPPAAAPAFSGLSAMTASVVRNRAAMEAAFCSAERVTFVGSGTPAASRSS